ncbi:MAG: proline racemase family protein [Actinomycetota bacterium]|nr:proline racemase family protein [Actinomycetota bacterium]
MNTRITVSAVDYHTAGEPFRIISGGVPAIYGDTVLDKRLYAMEKLDDIRRLVVNEPRGHADMYGCFIAEPDDQGADFGAVFFHNAGYSTACGHGTIALATWALESGLVSVVEPETSIVIDVPSGRLESFASIEDGRVESVCFRNVPSFVYEEGLSVTTSVGQIAVDIAFGGAFYACVDARKIDLGLTPVNVADFISLGREIKNSINDAHEISHPLEPRLRDIYGTIFFAETEGGGPLRQRNVTIFADGEVDRSPCGSGTSARLALLDNSGRLLRGDTLTHESIIGTEFGGRVVGETRVGEFDAVITDVEGSAYLTGYHQFVLHKDDPLGTGFLLR